MGGFQTQMAPSRTVPSYLSTISGGLSSGIIVDSPGRTGGKDERSHQHGTGWVPETDKLSPAGVSLVVGAPVLHLERD